MHLFATEGDYNVMVMDALGPNLEALFDFCERKFSESTVALIAIQCLDRLEHLHSKNLIHRDLKPENFLIGTNRREDTLFMIDYGLTKRYRDPRTNQHITFKATKNNIGTLRFSSINASKGFEQSRRDDLEALGYMMAYFIREGDLPWMGKHVKGLSKTEKMKKIVELKERTPFDELFDVYSTEFITYMYYCRAMPFDAKPDY